MQTLGMLKRSFKFLSRDLFLFLYRTYIRPHLEYCAPSWSPYLAKDIDALERQCLLPNMDIDALG